ncbi:MAG: hypothetical protein K2J47_12215, partial [Ruminococcus sp.]|nr:hypothetical protein [Ruminococcus sp.]
DYILTIDGNGNISSFNMPNNLFEINFSEVTQIAGTPAPTTESQEKPTVPAETTVQAENSNQEAN